MAVPALLLLRRFGGATDHVDGDDPAGSDMTCAAGLPAGTHVASHQVATLIES